MAIKTWGFSTTHPGGVPRPYLRVNITNASSGKNLSIVALIDTGADECALPTAYSGLLGHKLDLGLAKEIGTAGGEATAWSHTACLKIEGLEDRRAIIDFIPGLEIPILGVNSFLSGFVLTVDYPNKTFTLES